jgi:hypothetical protein
VFGIRVALTRLIKLILHEVKCLKLSGSYVIYAIVTSLELAYYVARSDVNLIEVLKLDQLHVSFDEI